MNAELPSLMLFTKIPDNSSGNIIIKKISIELNFMRIYSFYLLQFLKLWKIMINTFCKIMDLNFKFLKYHESFVIIVTVQLEIMIKI